MASGTLREIREALGGGNGAYIFHCRIPAGDSLRSVHRELKDARMDVTLLRESQKEGAVLRIDFRESGNSVSNVFDRIGRNGIHVEACYREEMSLDELFIKLVH
jgi:hypothetical protein